MTQLKNDPIRVVPKRALILAAISTVVLAVISWFMEWPMLSILGGLWLGVIANLINFRLIVIGTKAYLDKSEKGIKATMFPNLALRTIIYIAVLLGTLQLGTESFFASIMGISMVRIAIQLDGFFSIGYEK